MTFEQAQQYLLGTIDEQVSRREPHRLERMRAFLLALGNPQERYPTIHVGGTSGKGSTSTMIAAVLRAQGARTGLHTKPHLRSMTERARIDGAEIDPECFAAVLEAMMPAIEEAAAGGHRPSYYETLLALAFCHFARERVDAAVIEVGIGGLLDGTNVIVPQVSVITNVGLDHTEILGDTHEAIARDKAGIAKTGVPLISAVDHSGARAEIEAQCVRAGAPFVSVLDAVRIEPLAPHGSGQRFALETPTERYDIAMPLLGAFQRVNAATAVLALEHLPAPLRPTKAALEAGFARLRIAGRMERFEGKPGAIFDIAHNPDKAAQLARSLAQTFPESRLHFVVAIGQSKDAREILRAFAQEAASLTFTSFHADGRHAFDPRELLAVARSLGLEGLAIDDPIAALKHAVNRAAPEDLVVVSGSTFIVAQLRAWWLEHAGALVAR